MITITREFLPKEILEEMRKIKKLKTREEVLPYLNKGNMYEREAAASNKKLTAEDLDSYVRREVEPTALIAAVENINISYETLMWLLNNASHPMVKIAVLYCGLLDEEDVIKARKNYPELKGYEEQLDSWTSKIIQ